MNSSAYKRVLIKLSGEALMGDQPAGIAPDVIRRVAAEIAGVAREGAEVAVVIGAGNIFRGAGLAGAGMDRVTGDHMGMLATIINSLAMRDALEKAGAAARVMSAIPVGGICEAYAQARAVSHLAKGRVVILAGGTGNPFFTTDSAASLRAVEIGADLLIKATKVDGVFSADPVRDAGAERFEQIGYDDVIARGLNVMDTTAVVMCRDHGLPLRVLDMTRDGAMMRAVSGENEGTLVS